MQENIKLSIRLKTIASFVTNGAYFADIGSDHGYLSAYICQSDDEVRAIASEVRKGPFLRTKETVSHYQLTDKIDVRFGDGLTVLTENDPITDIVIAGMGGSLITDLLKAGMDHVQRVEKIIVQPNNNAEKLRRFFKKNNFILTEEVILEENNQIYEILVAEKNSHATPYDKEGVTLEKQLLFGPFLMQEKSSVFKKKWQREKDKIAKILIQIENKTENLDKINLFKRQLSWIEEVLQ